MRRILIYSEPVHSGKSTRLLRFLYGKRNTRGWISPDFANKRHLWFPAQHTYIPFQTTETEPRALISVGHYHFLMEGFEAARNELIDLSETMHLHHQEQLVVIDELGKLELKGSGFEPAFRHFLDSWKKNGKGTLILVIRDYLLEEAFRHYAFNPEETEIIGHGWFDRNIQNPDVMALILAGGLSRRMGADKAWIHYHGKPQVTYTRELALACIPEAIVSANTWPVDSKDVSTIKDHPQFKGHGPMSGLLSAHERHPQKAIMLLACDHPGLKTKHLQTLLSHRNPIKGITAYTRPGGVPEPLITLYEPWTLNHIRDQFCNYGFDSMRRYMQENGYHSIVLSEDESHELRSADKPHDWPSTDE